MGKVVTVMNMKGGVGKTTVTLHLGGLLGRIAISGTRRKVLLIDYDAQFNLTQCLVEPTTYYALESQHKTTLAILQDKGMPLDPYTLQVPGTVTPPLVKDLVYNCYKSTNGHSVTDLIPSTLDLMYIALGQSDVKTRPLEERFRHFIDEARQLYDVIFIDCHPAGSIFTKTSLRNSDHVLIPVALERFALRGVGLMMQFIEAKRRHGSSPTPHILFNYGPSGDMSSIEATVRGTARFKDHCLTAVLRRFKAFQDPVDGRGFVWTSSKPWSTQAFSNLHTVAEEVIQRTGL